MEYRDVKQGGAVTDMKSALPFKISMPHSLLKFRPQKGLVVWLTGLSGSGKSTLAQALAAELAASGHAVYILDGDALRRGLCADMGFSREDRAENIRRAGEVAALFADAGLICIAAFVSPYSEDRARARRMVPPGQFIEVFINAPIALCEERDPKELYRKARADLIPFFTGISDPYEAPAPPDVQVKTGELSVEQSVHHILEHLRSRL